mgnify:CR=1 FL=1
MKINRQKLMLLMASKSFSLLELSKNSGISATTICRMQRGNNCKPATIGKIAKALDCDVKELLED